MVQGDEWTLRLSGSGLATKTFKVSAVNFSDLTTVSEAGVLLIVNRNGAAPAARVDVTPATPTSVAPEAPTAAVQLLGNPVAGEKWTVKLDGRDYTATVGTVVTSFQALEDIATSLGAAIRFDNSVAGLVARLASAINLRGGDYTALASDTDLTITSSGGAITAVLESGQGTVVDEVDSAALSLTLSFAGASVSHGEEWTVRLDAAGTPTTVTATAFARFSAASDGTRLLIVDLPGIGFAPQTTIVPVSGYTIFATQGG